MVKMSADFPNEAARCQRFLSEGAQSNFEPRGQNGPAATRSPCYLMENTRSKDRVRGTNSVKRAVAQLGRAPGSGPGGRGFKSHQPDSLNAVSFAVLGLSTQILKQVFGTNASTL